jgi:hypothetical protein
MDQKTTTGRKTHTIQRDIHHSSLTSCNGNRLQTLQENTVFSVPELTTHVLASDGWSFTLVA